MANIEIGGRLHSTATGNVVTGANEVLDDTKNKKQSVINAEVDETIGDDNTAGTIKGRIKTAEGKLDTLNGDSSTSGSVAKAVADAKTELIGGATSNGNTLKKVEDRTATLETAVGSNGSVDQRIATAKSEVIGDAASDYNTLGKLEDKIQAEASARQDAITAETNRATTRENQIYDLVHTPEQHYVTVATYADLANIASPSDDTVYRVSSYNGKTSQVDNTVYSEYGYDGTNFVFLCVKSQIDEVYDISAHHSNNTYVDLAAALDGGNNIPQELRRGGMSVKYVQSSDNKYVQYRLMATSFSTTESDWLGGVDEVILTPSSKVKELYLLGNVDLYKDFHFQWLRTYPSGGVQVYQCRIAATLISSGVEMEVARVWEDTVNVDSLLKVLKIKEASGSGIRGFIVLNEASNWDANFINDTSIINIDVATNLGASGMISKHIDALKQVVVPGNPIEKIDNDVITTIGCVVFWGGGWQYISPTQLSIADNHTSLYLKYDTESSEEWGFAVISNNNPRDKRYIYIFIGEFNYKLLTWSIWNQTLRDIGLYNYMSGNSQLSPNRYFGIYIPYKVQVKGFNIKLYNNTEPVNIYLLNLNTNVIDLLATFSTSQLNIGVNRLNLPTPKIIGGSIQMVITGQYCYSGGHNEDKLYYSRKVIEYFPNSKISNIFYSTDVFTIEPILEELSEFSIGINNVGNNKIDFLQEIKGLYPLNNYTSVFNQPDKAVFRYIPFPCFVNSVEVNVTDTSSDVKVYSIDLETGVSTLLKSVTPSTTGALTINLDTPYKITETHQVGVSGIIGFRYNVNAGILRWRAYYYYFATQAYGNIVSDETPMIVDFSLNYNISPIEFSDACFKIAYNGAGDIANLKRRILPIESAVASTGAHETVTVNIADYNNNLMNVFNAINPSSTKHYVILIPEGTYNVDQWFTTEQIETSNETHWRGVELLDYTKLLGIGRRDKIILQWLNSDDNTHWGYISTLNTQHHNELENLTIKANNIRYCVHDDIWDGQDRYLRIKNCVFESYNRVSRAWGAGCNGGYDAIFENCQFIMHYYAPYDVDATSGYVEPMCLHDNYYNVDKLSYLVMRNCRFVLPYKNIKYRMEDNADSWEEIAYNSSYPMYDETKIDYAINDCVNMPNNTSHSYKCLYANSQIPPYMIGRPSLNIGFGAEGANGCLYATIEGCKMDTYLAASDFSRSTGFGNKFGSSPVLWTELPESKDIVFNFFR